MSCLACRNWSVTSPFFSVNLDGHCMAAFGIAKSTWTSFVIQMLGHKSDTMLASLTYVLFRLELGLIPFCMMKIQSLPPLLHCLQHYLTFLFVGSQGRSWGSLQISPLEDLPVWESLCYVVPQTISFVFWTPCESIRNEPLIASKHTRFIFASYLLAKNLGKNQWRMYKFLSFPKVCPLFFLNTPRMCVPKTLLCSVVCPVPRQPLRLVPKPSVQFSWGVHLANLLIRFLPSDGLGKRMPSLNPWAGVQCQPWFLISLASHAVL